MMKILINNLTKKYKKKRKDNLILDDINVTFESNKLYMIVGKSGVGKTTFLKCISLLINLDSGTVKINNKDLTKLNNQELSNFRNKNIGFVFQEYNLLEFLTTRENVLLPTLKNKNNANKEDRLKTLLDFVDLTDKIDYYPDELSGGEKQRVAITRALINDPDIILADEPTGNVDSKNKENIIKIFKNISRDNKCVIVVTHDNEILKYADKIYLLDEGKLIDYENK